MRWDLIAIPIVAMFVAASFAHGFRNAKRSDQVVEHPQLLRAFYASTVLFGLFVLALGLNDGTSSWLEVLAVLAMVAVIHGLRIHFERSVDTTKRTREASTRFGFDTLANLSTIVFAIFATGRGDTLLLLMAFGFGSMLVLKELKFRVNDDVDHVELKKRLLPTSWNAYSNGDAPGDAISSGTTSNPTSTSPSASLCCTG